MRRNEANVLLLQNNNRNEVTTNVKRVCRPNKKPINARIRTLRVVC